MVKVTVKDKEIYLDGYLKTNLDSIKTNIRKDWDYVLVVDGEVGSGKSVFVQQAAYYVSEGQITLDEVCFTPQQFKEAILKAPKYSAVIWDEAFRGLSARAAMTQTNRTIVAMLQEIRQKNLFVFIVLPSIWDLDKYVVLHRCKGLFHIHTDENKTRGFFKYYKKSKLTMMFANPMKWRYKYPHAPQFKGRFTKQLPLDEEAYKKKKWGALGDYGYTKKEPSSKKEEVWRERCSTLVNYLKSQSQGMTNEEIGEILGLNHRTVSKISLHTFHRGSSNLFDEQINEETKDI